MLGSYGVRERYMEARRACSGPGDVEYEWPRLPGCEEPMPSGIAQFMPQTAGWHGLADPFDPIEALRHSAAYLRELRDWFGNLGLAAAAYNAGPGRVSAWLASHRPLPGETRNYVAIITGWTADEWASGSPQGVPCTRLANLILAPKEEAKRIATYTALGDMACRPFGGEQGMGDVS
jgi:Transglycosylase SLT domain